MISSTDTIKDPRCFGGRKTSDAPKSNPMRPNRHLLGRNGSSFKGRDHLF